MFELLVSNRPGRPKFTPMRLNRVDAYPQLTKYHEAGNESGRRDAKTTVLPERTPIPNDYVKEQGIWYQVMMDQSHAYYEEIHTIPAAAMGVESIFPETSHWHIIHPLQMVTMETWSVRVLLDLQQWFEEREHMFVGKHPQVLRFKAARKMSLDEVRKELGRRKVDGIKDTEGYLGTWEDLDEMDFEFDADGREIAKPVVQIRDEEDDHEEEHNDEREGEASILQIYKDLGLQDVDLNNTTEQESTHAELEDLEHKDSEHEGSGHEGTVPGDSERQDLEQEDGLDDDYVVLAPGEIEEAKAAEAKAMKENSTVTDEAGSWLW